MAFNNVILFLFRQIFKNITRLSVLELVFKETFSSLKKYAPKRLFIINIDLSKYSSSCPFG